jgi:LysM repeat protein
MTKKTGTAIGLFIVIVILLTGCKMPASKGPEEVTEPAMTTPIVIPTDSPILITQTEVAKIVTTTIAVESGYPATTPTPTPEPTEVIVIPTMTVPEKYTVKSGETVLCLARRFDVDPDDIIALNNLSADGFLSVGDTLNIPQTGSYPYEDQTRMEHPTTYTVQINDTIYSIACKFGDVYPEEIIAGNNLEEPYNITAGESLYIP